MRASGRQLQVFLPPGEGRSRIGISVPRRVGGAVDRNRLRRRGSGRSSAAIATLLPRPVALVVNVRPAAAEPPSRRFSRSIARPSRKALSRTRPLSRGARLAVGLLALYKRSSRPSCPGRAAIEPTCSVYAREAIERHGLYRGSALALPAPFAVPSVPAGRIRPGAVVATRWKSVFCSRRGCRSPFSSSGSGWCPSPPRTASLARPRRAAGRRDPPAGARGGSPRPLRRKPATRGGGLGDSLQRPGPGEGLQSRAPFSTRSSSPGTRMTGGKPLELVRAPPASGPPAALSRFHGPAGADTARSRRPSSSLERKADRSVRLRYADRPSRSRKRSGSRAGYLFDVSRLGRRAALHAARRIGPAQPDREGARLELRHAGDGCGLLGRGPRDDPGGEARGPARVAASPPRVRRSRGQLLSRGPDPAPARLRPDHGGSRGGRLRPEGTDGHGGRAGVGDTRGARVLRPQGHRGARESPARPGEDGRLRMVRHRRPPAALAAQEGLRVGRQLRRRDPSGHSPDPDPDLPPDAQELCLDEEDAEARTRR